MAQTLDIPSRDQGSCPVCDQKGFSTGTFSCAESNRRWTISRVGSKCTQPIYSFNKKKALLGGSCAWTETVTQTCHGNFTMAAIWIDVFTLERCHWIIDHWIDISIQIHVSLRPYCPASKWAVIKSHQPSQHMCTEKPPVKRDLFLTHVS